MIDQSGNCKPKLEIKSGKAQYGERCAPTRGCGGEFEQFFSKPMIADRVIKL